PSGAALPLALHDALPIYTGSNRACQAAPGSFLDLFSGGGVSAGQLANSQCFFMVHVKQLPGRAGYLPDAIPFRVLSYASVSHPRVYRERSALTSRLSRSMRYPAPATTAPHSSDSASAYSPSCSSSSGGRVPVFDRKRVVQGRML